MFFILLCIRVEVDQFPEMNVCPTADKLSKQGVALRLLMDVMEAMELYLYHGDFYFRHPDALVTKVLFLPGQSLLGHIVANKDYMNIMLPNEQFLQRLIADENSTVIPQLKMDFDNIEVCC